MLAVIFRHLDNEGSFPMCLRLADVIPVPKLLPQKLETMDLSRLLSFCQRHLKELVWEVESYFGE